MTPLDDDQLGDRLTRALRDVTRDLPVLADAAGAARVRRGAQRRTRLIASGVTAALAVAVLALSLPHLGDSGTSRPSPADTPTSAPTKEPTDFNGRAWIPAGWRSESYDGIELAVPNAWQYGDLSEWCTLPDDSPVYDRPGGISGLVGCIGPGGYGVRFTEPEVIDPNQVYPGPTDGPTSGPFAGPHRRFPVGAAVRTRTIGDTMVLLVLKDATLADQVMATVHTIGAYDANGCAPTVDVPALGTPVPGADHAGPLSVCRYSVGPDPTYLEQSELLTGHDAADIRAALDAAPVGKGPDQSIRTCTDTSMATEVVQLRTAAGPVAWLHFPECRGFGFDVGTTTRKITAEVLHWALSPGWSGEIPGNLDFTERDLPAN